ncbi:hypothetical protein TcasGA2_TC005116 [Tribolium castaneum]|uniref:MULE transposase domain-containing protein n=1 Tax=Tribolium castaneum TaxID=7070 RepID=D7EIQ5_TRICA|nr:hypothetical protein TcasGA2_TC005116 [Tribolium castaneum]
MQSISATTRSVIGNTLKEVRDEVLAYMPKPTSLARSLRHHRQQHTIANPKTMHFDIPEKYQHLILYDSGLYEEDRILVLGDKELMLELNKDIIFGDGTFDKVPNMFYQLYTWHAQIGSSYRPCIYILLLRKDTKISDKMFKIMKQLVPNMVSQKILLDFEKACMNAARTAFPESEKKGCYFHLCQSLIRKINSVGLKTEYESDIDVKLRLKSLVALAFVPMQDVRKNFDFLAALFPNEDKFNEILTY